jgi:hypothetical protein
MYTRADPRYRNVPRPPRKVEQLTRYSKADHFRGCRADHKVQESRSHFTAEQIIRFSRVNHKVQESRVQGAIKEGPQGKVEKGPGTADHITRYSRAYTRKSRDSKLEKARPRGTVHQITMGTMEELTTGTVERLTLEVYRAGLFCCTNYGIQPL